jgi:uncharacterized protein YciI
MDGGAGTLRRRLPSPSPRGARAPLDGLYRGSICGNTGAVSARLTFAVVRDVGPAWDDTRELREQAAWDEHAEFMNALVDDGFVLVGGPLAGGPKTLLIVSASSEEEIRSRLHADPWTPMGLLVIARIEPWEVLLGAVPDRTAA